jgi:hypothetical protein
MTRSLSLGGSSPGLRTSTGGDRHDFTSLLFLFPGRIPYPWTYVLCSCSRGIKRSLNASRGSLSGLSSSQKKLRVLDLDEVRLRDRLCEPSSVSVLYSTTDYAMLTLWWPLLTLPGVGNGARSGEREDEEEARYVSSSSLSCPMGDRMD